MTNTHGIGTKERVMIIGGTGFVGQALAKRLSSDGIEVSIFDIAALPSSKLPSEIMFHKGDIMNAGDLAAAFSASTPTFVVVVASYGMSGAAMLNEKWFVTILLSPFT